MTPVAPISTLGPRPQIDFKTDPAWLAFVRENHLLQTEDFDCAAGVFEIVVRRDLLAVHVEDPNDQEALDTGYMEIWIAAARRKSDQLPYGVVKFYTGSGGAPPILVKSLDVDRDTQKQGIGSGLMEALGLNPNGPYTSDGAKFATRFNAKAGSADQA